MRSDTSREAELLVWLASLPPSERDAAIEEHFGIAASTCASSPPGEHLIGYHASGIAPILRMLIEIPVANGDVVVDLGAGLGKVLLVARLLTGASVRGVELQPELVERARKTAAKHGIEVQVECGDARRADLDDGTVFFLYLPFTGPVLAEVVERLRAVAARRAIVVCALGVDLDRVAPWLVRRPSESFWLAIYDSVLPGIAPRSPRERSVALGPEADAIALELPADDFSRAMRGAGEPRPSPTRRGS